MADEETMKKLDARLSRLEAALSQQQPGNIGVKPPGGFVSDPAPYPGGGWGHPYPRWPHPMVDPGPWGGPWGPWGPRPVVDSPPWPNPIVDSAVSDPNQLRTTGAGTLLARIGHIGDPAVMDLSRFTISQLESSLHSINAEKARLASMETMVSQQLEKLKK